MICKFMYYFTIFLEIKLYVFLCQTFLFYSKLNGSQYVCTIGCTLKGFVMT